MIVPITRGTTGLRTESDPVRAIYNKDAGGLRDLSACMDVDISDSLRISRRKGNRRTLEADGHSLFPVNDEYLLFVTGDALTVLDADLETATAIRNVTPGARVSYCLLDGIVYYVNGFEIGKVEGKVSKSWSFSQDDYVGRNLTRPFYGPPIGQRIAFYKGRFYIAQKDVAWYSEPYGPNLWAMGDSFLSFESNNTMLRPVDGGIYVSDEHDTWFLAGSGPDDFQYRKVDSSPALPWSDQNFTGSIVQTKEGEYTLIPAKQESAMWLTQRGVVYGSASGEVSLITEEKIDMPGTYTEGACLVDHNHFIGIAR